MMDSSNHNGFLYDPNPKDAQDVIHWPISFCKRILEENIHLNAHRLCAYMLFNEAISRSGKQYHGLDFYETLLSFEMTKDWKDWTWDDYIEAIDELITYGFEFVILRETNKNAYLVRFPEYFNWEQNNA